MPKRKGKKIAKEEEIQEKIVSSVPDNGIFFDSLTKKASGKLEKLKIKKSTIDKYIMKLIRKGEICWREVKLFRPPNNASFLFFYINFNKNSIFLYCPRPYAKLPL